MVKDVTSIYFNNSYNIESYLDDIYDKIKTKRTILPLTPPPDLIPPIEFADTILPP